jgi:uncharacterized protein (DUF2062 family)
MRAVTYLGYLVGCVALGILTGVLSRLVWRMLERRLEKRKIIIVN